MMPEWWLTQKRNGGSLRPDRWLKTTRIIHLSGSSLGRPKKNALADKKTEYVDNADRIEVERFFSLAKRCQ